MFSLATPAALQRILCLYEEILSLKSMFVVEGLQGFTNQVFLIMFRLAGCV